MLRLDPRRNRMLRSGRSVFASRGPAISADPVEKNVTAVSLPVIPASLNAECAATMSSRRKEVRQLAGHEPSNFKALSPCACSR